MSKGKLPSYDAQNLAIARQFLADPEQYGGEGSGRLEWARMVVERIEHWQAVPAKGQERPMPPAINKTQDVDECLEQK